MIALLDLYKKELLKMNGFTPSMVETHLISVKALCEYAAGELNKCLDWESEKRASLLLAH